ncbi:MAG: hypothetical protein V1778_01855 [bacterium]
MPVRWKETVYGKDRDAIQQRLEELVTLWLSSADNVFDTQTNWLTCTLVDLSTGEQLMPQFRVGDMSLKEVLTTGYFSYRQSLALMEHPGDWTTEPSSSPNPENLPLSQRYPRGGIRVKSLNYGILIAGLPWPGNQAVACALGRWFGVLTTEDISRIATESGNDACIGFAEHVNRQ